MVDMDPKDLQEMSALADRARAVLREWHECRAKVAALAAERDQILRELRARGLTVAQIGDLVGLSRGATANVLWREAKAPAPAPTPAKKSPAKRKDPR